MAAKKVQRRWLRWCGWAEMRHDNRVGRWVEVMLSELKVERAEQSVL